MDYRKASEPTSTTNNECVSAALGENRTPSQVDEFNIPTVKFPSQEDEYETLKLFRRCAGPLAATFAGREKLSREGESIYGDGRPLQLCRVAGCQNTHGPRRMLCNWHRVMIESAKEGVMTNKRWKPQLLDSESANEVGGGESEQKPAAIQMIEPRRIFTAVVTKPSNDTKLGIGIQNGKGSIEITSIAPGSLLAGTELKVGMKIESINGRSFLACADCKTCADFLGSAVGQVTIVASSVTAPLGRHHTQEVDPASRKRPFIDIKEAASSSVVPPKTKAPWLSNDSSKSQKSSEPTAMAVDIPLEPADAEIEQFMGC